MKLKTGEALRSYSTVYKLQLEIPVSTHYDVLTKLSSKNVILNTIILSTSATKISLLFRRNSLAGSVSSFWTHSGLVTYAESLCRLGRRHSDGRSPWLGQGDAGRVRLVIISGLSHHNWVKSQKTSVSVAENVGTVGFSSHGHLLKGQPRLICRFPVAYE